MLAALAASPAAAAQAGSKASNPPLTRAQFIREMEAEFRAMDADRNGLLSPAEIEEDQRQKALQRAEARNRQLFAELDSNRDGQLSKAEFAKMAAPGPAPDARQVLGRMDANRDSQVSRAEHQAATLANFDRLDADRDGRVTAAEMQAAGLSPR